MRMQGFAKGIGDYLSLSPEALLTQIILSQAAPEAEARSQLEQLLRLINDLGVVTAETNYDADLFRFDLRWKLRERK